MRLLQTLVLGLMLQIVLEAKTIPFPNYARLDAIAARVMNLYQLDPQKYSMMKRNLVCYLGNYLPTRDILLSEVWDDEKLLSKVVQGNFWSEKLERDLSVPYSDQDLVAHFARIQNEVNQFLEYLEFANRRKSPVQIYVFGSIPKGRFGANSSIDFYIDSDDKDLLNRLEQGVYRADHPGFKGNLNLITSLFEPSILLDPLLPVSLRELRELYPFYQNLLEGLGFNGGSPKLVMEFNPIEDRVYFLSRKTGDLLKNLEQNYHVYAHPTLTEKESSDKLKANLSSLLLSWEEVLQDLQILQGNQPGPRLWKMKKVIQKESLRRMQEEGLTKSLLDFVTAKVAQLRSLSS